MRVIGKGLIHLSTTLAQQLMEMKTAIFKDSLQSTLQATSQLLLVLTRVEMLPECCARLLDPD